MKLSCRFLFCLCCFICSSLAIFQSAHVDRPHSIPVHIYHNLPKHLPVGGGVASKKFLPIILIINIAAMCLCAAGEGCIFAFAYFRRTDFLKWNAE